MRIVCLSRVCMYSKHVLEEQSEEEPGISSETTLIAEHERLAAEYHNERALLEEALRKSKDDSHTSDNESTEEVECAAVAAEKEPSDKLQLRKMDPLKPIPTSKKKSDEDEVFTFGLFAVVRYQYTYAHKSFSINVNKRFKCAWKCKCIVSLTCRRMRKTLKRDKNI